MSVRINTRNARRRRRLITYLWIATLTVLTISLIYWELTAILYILATVGVTVLLVVVATTDLAHGERFSTESLTPEQAAPGATGVTQTFGNKSADWGAKKRK